MTYFLELLARASKQCATNAMLLIDESCLSSFPVGSLLTGGRNLVIQGGLLQSQSS